MKKAAIVLATIAVMGAAVYIAAAPPKIVKEFSGSLWPSHSCTYDLGALHRKWAVVYAQKICADTVMITIGPITIDLIPDLSCTYDLGDPSHKWRRIYVQNVQADTCCSSGGGGPCGFPCGDTIVFGNAQTEAGAYYDTVFTRTCATSGACAHFDTTCVAVTALRRFGASVHGFVQFGVWLSDSSFTIVDNSSGSRYYWQVVGVKAGPHPFNSRIIHSNPKKKR